MVQVLSRKLAVLKQKYKKSQPEFEKYGVIVISSLYGIDLLEDNVEECRNRLLKIFEKEYISVFKHEFNNKYVNVIRFILSKNIVSGVRYGMVAVDREVDMLAVFSLESAKHFAACAFSA